MTIIASNSLTLSNVNDGTITHVAYAYSADGTDRFTTVYPKPNLLSGTKVHDIFKGTGTANAGGTQTYTLDKSLKISDLKLSNYQQLIFEFDWKATGTNPSGYFLYQTQTYYKGTGVTISPTNTSGHVKNTFYNLPVATDTSTFMSIRQDNIPTTVTVEISNVMMYIVDYSPWMPSSSEVTSADWPSYIGQYSDFSSTASTDPAKYVPWTIFKGNDGKDGLNGKDGIAGKDGVGLKTTVITYAISTSGTTAPTSGWTTQVPTLIKGQYLWTKTVWTYTDNTNGTGYSVTYISKDGNNGTDGVAGKDGVGIKITTITYAGSTSGTTVPTTGWTSSIPTVAAGSYLWTKTVWTYTDNTSETGYSVAKMGNTGPAGAPGSNGAPGKVVSDTEPISLFKGLTWKYSGTANLTASDGTVISPNTEYYYNGTHWMINYLSANNLEANSITADLIDAKNLTITDGEFVSTIIDGAVQIHTEIKDDHLLIYKMDTSTNSINTIALKSDSGLAMTYQNSDTGEYTSAGVNFQGLFMQNNITNEFARLTPQGTKLSTDVPWTKLSLMNNFTGNIEYAIINGTVYISASGVGVPAMTAGQWKQAAQLPTGSSAIPIRANRITAGDSGDGLSWALLSNQAGGLFIRCSANKAATANLFNATLPYPIG